MRHSKSLINDDLPSPTWSDQNPHRSRLIGSSTASPSRCRRVIVSEDGSLLSGRTASAIRFLLLLLTYAAFLPQRCVVSANYPSYSNLGVNCSFVPVGGSGSSGGTALKDTQLAMQGLATVLDIFGAVMGLETGTTQETGALFDILGALLGFGGGLSSGSSNLASNIMDAVQDLVQQGLEEEYLSILNANFDTIQGNIQKYQTLQNERCSFLIAAENFALQNLNLMRDYNTNGNDNPNSDDPLSQSNPAYYFLPQLAINAPLHMAVLREWYVNGTDPNVCCMGPGGKCLTDPDPSLLQYMISTRDTYYQLMLDWVPQWDQWRNNVGFEAPNQPTSTHMITYQQTDVGSWSVVDRLTKMACGQLRGGIQLGHKQFATGTRDALVNDLRMRMLVQMNVFAGLHRLIPGYESYPFIYPDPSASEYGILTSYLNSKSPPQLGPYTVYYSSGNATLTGNIVGFGAPGVMEEVYSWSGGDDTASSQFWLDNPGVIDNIQWQSYQGTGSNGGANWNGPNPSGIDWMVTHKTGVAGSSCSESNPYGSEGWGCQPFQSPSNRAVCDMESMTGEWPTWITWIDLTAYSTALSRDGETYTQVFYPFVDGRVGLQSQGSSAICYGDYFGGGAIAGVNVTALSTQWAMVNMAQLYFNMGSDAKNYPYSNFLMGFAASWQPAAVVFADSFGGYTSNLFPFENSLGGGLGGALQCRKEKASCKNNKDCCKPGKRLVCRGRVCTKCREKKRMCKKAKDCCSNKCKRDNTCR